jgi:cobaltochelatase CobT
MMKTKNNFKMKLMRIVIQTVQEKEDSQEEDSDANPEQSQEEQQDAGQASVSLDDDASDDMSEETELPEGESPIEPPAPQPISEADPNYKVFATNMMKKFTQKNLLNL